MAGSARGRYCAKICLRQGCVSRAQPFRLRRAGQRLPPAEVLRASSQPPSVPLANRCGDDVIPRGCGRLARGPAVRDAEGSCCERCCHLMEGEQLLQRASQPAAGWPREGHPGGARVILRLTQAWAGQAERSPACYVLRGLCALPRDASGLCAGAVVWARREARPCRMWQGCARTTRSGTSTPPGLARGTGQTGAGCGHRGRVSRSARGPHKP